ncbi:MAG: hypothetical protein HKN25_11290 [Pyrinomonadaceae bacterium]|nr:hypothetical protein [Pyrinomonadaceae bacterium]
MILFENNILLGGIPESVGLLLFGIALIVLPVGLRWLTSDNAVRAAAQDPVKSLVQGEQDGQDLLAENLVLENK